MSAELPPGFRIRLGVAADVDALVELERRSFTLDRFPAAQLRYLLTRAHGTALVMEQRRRIVGLAIMLWRKNSSVGHLYDLAIDPSLQGRGLGSRLLRACEKRAVQRGCTRISLEVRAGNRPAVALYQKRGYEIIDSLPGYYENGASGLRMVKRLKTKRAR